LKAAKGISNHFNSLFNYNLTKNKKAASKYIETAFFYKKSL